jgi:hypothetical protein
MPDKIKSLFQSRRWYAALSVPLAYALNRVFELNIPEEILTGWMYTASAWIVGDSLGKTVLHR